MANQNEKITAKDILSLLRQKYLDSREWVVASEVQRKTGWSDRRYDFVAMNCFESTGQKIEVVEIKVSKADLSKALRPRPEKFIGKAVKSNVKRVTNISDHLKDKDPDILWFTDFLGKYVCSRIKDITPYRFTDDQLKKINHLKDSRYATDEWNFGKSPQYTFSNIKRFPKGIVELYLKTKNGRITDLDIRGDYFFSRPTEEFTRTIIGTPHTREDIQKKIGTLDTGAYFAGIDSEDIVSLFF